MGKQSGLLKRQKEEQTAKDRLLQDATRQTFVQYMTDTLICVLNDPDVMGKDVFGYARLKKVLEAWGKCYDLYFDALTVKDEADYFREMLDRALRRVVPEGEHFDPFEQRYEWLPRILYGEKGKKGGVSR
jgi:hypothetical protein